MSPVRVSGRRMLRDNHQYSGCCAWLNQRPEAYKEQEALFGQLVRYAVQQLEKSTCHIEHFDLLPSIILSKRGQTGHIEDAAFAVVKAKSDEVKVWYRVSESFSLICSPEDRDVGLSRLREAREEE